MKIIWPQQREVCDAEIMRWYVDALAANQIPPHQSYKVWQAHRTDQPNVVWCMALALQEIGKIVMRRQS